MRLPSLPRTLRRGVGRRILGFFVLAGILPVIFTAALAYNEMWRGLEQDVRRSLTASAKTYALDVMSRLQRTAAATEQLALLVAESGTGAIGAHPYLLRDVEMVWRVDNAGRTTLLHGVEGDVPDLVSLNLDSAKLPGLVTVFDADGGNLVLLQPIGQGGLRTSILAVKPDQSWLWGGVEGRPFATEFCMLTVAGAVVHCTADVDRVELSSLPAAIEKSMLAPVEWAIGGEAHLASKWQLFLAVEFGASALDFIASQPKSYALQSRTDFSRVFLPALGLVVVLVGLLSFSMIGQSLEPLQKLTTAARQIASGNLLSRVRIRSGDEFEWLGEAFNTMADRIGRQIATLEAMSEIDRQILSGTEFEAVAESVIRNVIELTGCEAAAVIARDRDTPHWAKMISSGDGEFRHQRMALPMDMGHNWCQPRQVSLDEISGSVAPYKAAFEDYGMSFVVLIPVILDSELKGLLLLGSRKRFDMQQLGLQRSIDLAGRFAVALASVEREEALYRQAHFDPLTGLPNRQLLKDRLEQQIVHARRESLRGALLFLDLDRFKEINDIYGHSVGDIVLMQAAERIVGEVRDSDTVARLGGDEFVVVLPHVSSDSRVRATATRLLDRLTEPFTVRGENHFVGASIGIVMFPEDGDSVETLLKNADAAMYRAKEAGRARFEFFSRKLNAESRRKIGLERDLRAAFYDDELDVYYQPQFDIRSGVISGAEALLRWRHGAEGYVSPDEFVPLAEDSDLIVDIGRWVIQKTCRNLRNILNKGLHPGAISINVSARQLRDPRFVSDVLEPLHRYSLHPGYLQLEVTETTVAQNRETAIELLQQLRNEGVRIAIDDFGTGYSSLSYLQQLPFDLIKIDKSFVDRIGGGDPSDNICRTIIKMAHELGKKAIAEGVESGEQVSFLKSYNCDFVQGFFYSAPLRNDDFVLFIEKQDFHTQRRKALEIV